MSNIISRLPDFARLEFKHLMKNTNWDAPMPSLPYRFPHARSQIYSFLRSFSRKNASLIWDEYWLDFPIVIRPRKPDFLIKKRRV